MAYSVFTQTFVIDGTESHRYEVNTHTFADLREKRYLKNSTVQRKWSGRIPYMTSSERTTLLAFWNARNGKHEAFYLYLPPEAPDATGVKTTNRILVRFDMDELNIKHTDWIGLYEANLKFIEVLS